MSKKIVIWGAGAQARVVSDVIGLTNEFQIVGFVDNTTTDRHGDSFCNSIILGGSEVLPALYQDGVRFAFMAFGDDIRLELAASDLMAMFTFATLIHPSAAVSSDTLIGSGTLIKAGVTIDPSVRIGQHCSIGAQTAIAHGAAVHDGAILSVHCSIGANADIGRAAQLSPAVVVGKGQNIGSRSIIGSGSVVTKHIPEGVLAFGNPARIIRRLDA